MEQQEHTPQEKKPAHGKYYRATLALAGVALILVGFLIGWIGYSFTVDSRLRSLGWMIKKVAGNYYQEVDEDTLYDRLYDALELDRFCTHYTPDEYARLRSESEGYNTGYGVSVSALESGTRIFDVVYNSPAELAGLEGGMYVLEYGTSQESLHTGTRSEFLDFMGKNGSCVLKCGFSADGSDAALYEMTKREYAASYCSYADSELSYRFRGENKLTLTPAGEGMSLLDGRTAYIRLTQFDGKAAEEFKACLELMKERGRKDLVIDLRCNGGGYMSILCQISSHLLKNATGRSPLVTTARYRSGKETKYNATGNDYSDYFGEDSRIRVFADENTASASECLIGAMIDYGTITYDDIYLRKDDAGEAHSYGKGVMQSAFTAPDGNAMYLTVAEIFWPKGNSIHGRGVRAEDGAHAIDAPLLPSYEDEFLKKVFS